MDLKNKLDFLLKLFNTNMSKLAKIINVDPSLVSKWRSGKRKLTYNSYYLNSMVEYFSKNEMLSLVQKELFIEFQRHNIKIPNWDNIKSVEKAFIHYLTSKDFKIVSKTNHKKTTLNSEIEGDIQNYQVFYGQEGKRKAAIKFLKSILASPSPLEILLFSQEEMDWLLGDKEFLLKWGMLMKEVIKNGHYIKVIHHVNRDPSQIISVIEQWLPLHLSGSVEAWFVPNYSALPIKTTIFVAKETAAIMAIAPLKQAESDFNFYYEDSVMVMLAEQIFYSTISQCKKLFYSFKKSNSMLYAEQILDLEKQISNSISTISCLSTVTLPTTSYESVLKKSQLNASEKVKLIDLHKKRELAFKNNLKSVRHIEVSFIEDSYSDILKNYFMDYIGSIDMSTIKNSASIYIEHASNLISYLKNYNNFEHIIIEKSIMNKFLNINFFVKNEKGVVISSNTQAPYEPLVIAFTEPTVVKAFEDFLLTTIHSIPSVLRNRERNIGILEERILNIKCEKFDLS